jgi:dienelactone hydrolase
MVPNVTRRLLFTTFFRDNGLEETTLIPAIRGAVVSVGILFFLVKCTASAPALEKDDLFASYAKGVPKVTTVISEEAKDGVKVTTLRFASAEGSKEGEVKDCAIYAIIAQPANTTGQKLPGLLVCHGGGGMAGEGGPIAWAKLGYVAIAPDLSGYGANDKMLSISRVIKIQFGADQIIPLKPTPYVCVLFDAVTAGLGAFNLLEAQPDVDPQKLFLTGISWGGYMVSGLLDERVKGTFNLYGSGFYQLEAIGSGALKKMDEADRNTWLKCFDAGTRLNPRRQVPLLRSEQKPLDVAAGRASALGVPDQRRDRACVLRARSRRRQSSPPRAERHGSAARRQGAEVHREELPRPCCGLVLCELASQPAARLGRPRLGPYRSRSGKQWRVHLRYSRVARRVRLVWGNHLHTESRQARPADELEHENLPMRRGACEVGNAWQ